MKDLMNYSPTFDKKTPVLWKNPKEQRTYLKIEDLSTDL